MQPFPKPAHSCLTLFSEQVECDIGQPWMKGEKTTGKAIKLEGIFYKDDQQLLLGLVLMTFLIRCC